LFLVVRGLLDPLIGSYLPYLAVLPAVVLSAWLCGMGPALLSMVLSFFGDQYWFIPPTHTLALVNIDEVIAAVAYFLVALTIIAFAETNRRTMAKLAVRSEQLRQAGEELSRSHVELERRVVERTHQLQESNQELAAQAERVRELSGKLLQAQDEERRRFARELHDSVGQLVAALGMNLSLVRSEMDRLSPSAAGALTENASLIQELSRQIRTISHLLHPPLLDEIGLSSALEWYVQGFAERSRIEVALDLPENLSRLPRDMEIAIFRIIQEALTNVHRHSGSSTAAVKIENSGPQVRIEIRDAGRGIPPKKRSELTAAGRAGVGINGMRERLRQFGGTLRVESEEGRTAVIATVPIPRAKSAGSASSV
jgi:signal transduction histidine kinase